MESLDLSDPAATWTERPAMPTARPMLAVASAGTKLFAVGGVDTQSWSELDILEIFDTTTDTWTTGSPMPTVRESLTAAIVGNSLFAMGCNNGRGTTFDVVEVYDIEAGTWSTAPPMATARDALAAVAVP